MKKENIMPDYLFEVSWEVCNNIGGIHDALAAKALNLSQKLGDRHIHIGPDVWMHTRSNPEFIEDPSLFRNWKVVAAKEGIRVRIGRWNVPGKPVAILVDFKEFIQIKDKIFGKAWELYKVDSLNGNWEYIEAFLFGYAAGKVIESFSKYTFRTSHRIVAQFNEWIAGVGLLYIKGKNFPISTVFTTHSTAAGRCMSELNIPVDQQIDADAFAREHSLNDRHSIEKAAAHNADIFTASDDITARECEVLLGRKPEAVTPDATCEADLDNYTKAYNLAMNKTAEVFGQYPLLQDEQEKFYPKQMANYPNWNRIQVGRQFPKRLEALEVLSTNLWWCWNDEAIDLFRSIDPVQWEKVKRNPIALLDNVSLSQCKALTADEAFLAKLDKVYADFQEYMAAKAQRSTPSIAYFCMEYGLDTSLKIYSGGLGILAGDYLKEASDMAVNLTAVGLLYKYGYFTQNLSGDGDQVAVYDPQNFRNTPARPVRDESGKWVTVKLALPGRNLYARVWKVEVGRTDLYLLDTDFEDNLPEDRSITHQLYGGNWENRLKQEILLGIGGIRTLRALGIDTQVYHCNEGHAAFIGIERIREYVEHNHLSFGEALEVVRGSSLFTTHTPVPAGHDFFSEDLLRVYLGQYPERMNIDWHSFMGLGRYNINDNNEKFSMSVLAANMSQGINGVSWLHGKVSQKILAGMWPGYLPEEVNVGYVTNGVHYPTWAAPEWKAIHARVFGPEFATHHYDKKCFEGIYNIEDSEIWNTRCQLRSRLISKVKAILSDTTATAHYSPRQIVKIKKTLRDDVLTIGFARRFATYKRATLLFRDLERLNQIVNNPDRPVQFLFAGKAHPADKAGSDLIKQIVEISKMPQFIGKIVFVPNYDITLAKYLVQGVDIWMNTPTRPQEASGTSGEKAVMNGVMHFSVLDGWWVEGYKEGAGWALPMERTYDNQDYQNDLDAATIYNIIENDIAPAYYSKEMGKEYSANWIRIIKETIAKVACNFTTNRMMEDYLSRYYRPLAERRDSLVEKDFLKARENASWKKRMYRIWPEIEVRRFNKIDMATNKLRLGEENFADAEVYLADALPEDVGIECVVAEQDEKGEYHICEIHEFEVVSFEDGVATYRADITPEHAGSYQVATRMFAKNPCMAHRQDFELVKWL